MGVCAIASLERLGFISSKRPLSCRHSITLHEIGLLALASSQDEANLGEVEGVGGMDFRARSAINVEREAR